MIESSGIGLCDRLEKMAAIIDYINNGRMERQVKELTIAEFKALMQDTLEEFLEQFFEDPDAGSEVREEVKQRLIESRKRTQAGERGIPLEDAVKKLGLER